jgi:hypothetical protein
MKYPESGKTVPITIVPHDKVNLTMAVGDGTFGLNGEEVKIEIVTLIPNGSIQVWIGDGEKFPRQHYEVDMKDVMEAAIEAYKEKDCKGKDRYDHT